MLGPQPFPSADGLRRQMRSRVVVEPPQGPNLWAASRSLGQEELAIGLAGRRTLEELRDEIAHLLGRGDGVPA